MKPYLCASVIALTAALAFAADPPDGSFDKSLNVSGAVDLDVTTDAGGITVRPGQPGTVRVRAYLKKHRGGWNMGDLDSRIRALEANPPIEQTGDRIRVGYVKDPNLLKGISMRLEIETPAETKLHAAADSGGVRVSGIRGPAEVSTDSGGIEIEGIGADVKANADSGGIHIRGVQGSVFARADSGGIEALGVAGAIDVSTDSGGIELEQTKAAPVIAQADSGGASLKLAPGSGYSLNIESDSGRVSTPEMTVRGQLSRRRAEGQIRGGGPLINIRVDSGNITVE